MKDKKTAVFAIFSGVPQAERAVDALVQESFTNDDVSVLMADHDASKGFAHEKQTKAPEGTATGVAAGGTIGGTLGLLAGIGALAIPGVGPLIAAGPIMGALAGLGVGGAVGGIIGALVGMGIPEYRSQAVPRSDQGWRGPGIRALRHLRRDRSRQGHPEASRRRRHRVGR